MTTILSIDVKKVNMTEWLQMRVLILIVEFDQSFVV